MDALTFIKQNPFPENGEQLNCELVRDIQNPDLEDLKQKNTETLFRMNARLIWLVFIQYNYGESIDSVMSFMWEGIRKSSQTYRLDSGVPFYYYAMATTRSMLQAHHMYKSQLIHIPIKKRTEISYEFVDVNEYMDLEASQFIDMSFDTDDVIDEIYELVDNYAKNDVLSDVTKYGLSIVDQMKTKSMREICSEMDIGEDKFRDNVKSIIKKLKKYKDYGR